MHLLSTYLSKHPAMKRFKQKVVLAFIIISALTLINCGKRKPPLPPVERVQQRAELSGFQRGDKIILSWKMPARNASDSDLLNIDRAELYRLVEPVSAPYSLSEEEFAARSIVISSVNFSNDDFFKTKSAADSLEFAGQPIRLIYALRFINKSGQKAAFSNFLVIEPAGTIPVAPGDLQAVVTQEAVRLSWTEPKQNINKSQAAGILGYNVYRSESEAETAKLLTKNPISGDKFDDEFFEFGKTYFYFVRAVSLGNQSEPVESAESNVVKISPFDNFPPSAPGAITIAAAPGTISIFFAVNPEKDVVGYKIFRSTDPNLPVNQWRQINDELLTANSVQDSKIESGVKYYYYLQAVDRAGNISRPSEIVSETAP